MAPEGGKGESIYKAFSLALEIIRTIAELIGLLFR